MFYEKEILMTRAFSKRAPSPTLSKSPTATKKLYLKSSIEGDKEQHESSSFFSTAEPITCSTAEPIKSTTTPALKMFIKAQENVGIKSFLTLGSSQSLPEFSGFHGIIKHRFNDFHVQEIDEMGKRIVLSDLKISNLNGQKKDFDGGESDLLKELMESSETVPNEEKVKDNTQNVDRIKEICNELQSILDQNQDFASFLFEFISSFDPAKDPISMKSPVINQKEKRREFHDLIRKLDSILQHQSIDSKTINSNQINLAMTKKENMKSSRSNLKVPFQKKGWIEKGEYCHFTLYKENKDTMEAISLISKLLRVESKLFTFCGTKDKRGITTQRVSAYRISQERLAGLNKTLRGIKLGNFSYEKERLQLGDSKGNHFSIVIREVQVSTFTTNPSSLLKTCLDTLSSKGFINYFGMQRFGSRQISTHVIGSLLLLGKWEEACMQILGKDEPLPPTKSTSSTIASTTNGKPNTSALDFHTAKEYLFTTMDFKGALTMFPRYCTAERSILNSFISQQKNGGGSKHLNYLQAIQSITRNLRLMYVHAYQSRVWNEMVSIRHEKFGMKLVVGDFVRIKDEDKEGNLDDQELAILQDDDLIDQDLEEGKRRGLYNIKVIESDQDTSNFTIYDLVLPLPGHQVKYPSNMEQEYISFMANDGFDPREMSRKVREMSLPGFYRNVYALPTNVNGYMVKYSDELKKPVDFLVSDLQKLENTSGELDKDMKDNLNQDETGNLVAFILEFSLASSQYATMALREIMKTETSSSFHSSLSLLSKDH